MKKGTMLTNDGAYTRWVPNDRFNNSPDFSFQKMVYRSPFGEFIVSR